MRTRSIRVALTAIVLTPALLAACGTSDGDDTATEQTARSTATTPASSGASQGGSGDCAGDTTPTSSGPVSLTDSFGRKVELAQPAKRVAVLEWQQVEDVLTLCVTPVWDPLESTCRHASLSIL